MGSRWLTEASRRLFSLSSVARSNAVAASSGTLAMQKRLDNAFSYYEDVIGLTTVKQAQNEVELCEEKLNLAQVARRDKQYELKALHSKLKEIHLELDRTSRGEDKYLHLITEEHATLKKERKLHEEFEMIENKEREAFHDLSNKIR
ncbi:hypothetical protein L596_004263 [Steinernema carpocapsae]|uniref:Uncharacterized protein n=1 Tax=Steinernema carpocapsae TaxID=34508 RepID=A0A4U8UWA2_STECR|nr:hypothetical protein L596_004263 [Steinernema carpocapsae]